MKKKRKATPAMERTRRMWMAQIVQEKGVAVSTAEWMTARIEALIEHMKHGHAVVAYRRASDGEFCFVKATLVGHTHRFGREYEAVKVRNAVLFFDVCQQQWKRFRIESFMEWKPVV